MSKQIVIRIPDDLADDLARISDRSGQRRSEVVRQALLAYLRPSGRPSLKPADRVRHLLGALESGVGDLARNHRRYVLESLTRGG
jgi:metal-responsive CopG/Arc/MetJ family transcriptional regulator